MSTSYYIMEDIAKQVLGVIAVQLSAESRN